MISIKECKAMLEESGAKYTDEEIEKIRDMLYNLARLDIELFKEREKNHEHNNSSTNTFDLI